MVRSLREMSLLHIVERYCQTVDFASPVIAETRLAAAWRMCQWDLPPSVRQNSGWNASLHSSLRALRYGDRETAICTLDNMTSKVISDLSSAVKAECAGPVRNLATRLQMLQTVSDAVTDADALFNRLQHDGKNDKEPLLAVQCVLAKIVGREDMLPRLAVRLSEAQERSGTTNCIANAINALRLCRNLQVGPKEKKRNTEEV